MVNEIPKDVIEALRCGDWFGASCRLRRHESAEEKEALCEHTKRWSEIRTAFQAECEKNGGHEFGDLPNNGLNNPHFVTGLWPRACKKCRMREPSPNAADQQRAPESP